MPVRIIITDGTTADCTQASKLIEGIKAEHLLGDKGYDSDEIMEQAKLLGMNAVIPPEKIEKLCESMTKTYINCAISLRMPSCISNVGGELQLDTLKTRLHFWLQCKYDALLFGLTSRDYTI